MICTDMTMVNMSRSSSSTISANSGATLMADATFYVLSSDNNVYKVIDNNGNSAFYSRTNRNININIDNW